MGFAPSLRRTRTRWATVAIAATAALFASALVSIPAPAHALADTGTGGQFVPVQQRIFDSRNTTWGNTVTPVTKGHWTSIPVEGSNGLPDDIGAVQVTLTETNASANGVVYADKTGVDTPNTSMPYLTWYDTNVSNTAILPVGDDGSIQVSTNVASMNLTVDVQGYYTSGATAAGGYVPLSTATKVFSSGTTKYATGQTVDIPIGGQAGVPANASSAMINITEAGSTSGDDGYLAYYPTGSSMPTAPSLNWTSGQNAEFTVPAKLGTNGKITIRINKGGSVALAVGIQGYFTATNGTAVLTPAHTRVYDSRSTKPVAQVAANGTRKIQIAGVGGVPVMGSGLTAAAVNVYIISGVAGGHVNVAADDAPIGDDAQQYYTNRITYGFTTVKLGADGGINLKNFSTQPVDVLVDVEGWFTNPLAPTISCPTPYVSGSWTDATPDSISCTITAPAASSTGGYLEVASSAGLQDVDLADSAATTVTSVLVPGGGVNEIDATVFDSDGNSLATASDSFGLGNWSTEPLSLSPSDMESVPTPVYLSALAGDGSAFMDDTTVSYTVSAEPDMTSALWTSDPTSDQVNVPDGILQDGQTYYWTAAVSGSTNLNGTLAQVTSDPQAFTVDNTIDDSQQDLPDDGTPYSPTNSPSSLSPGSTQSVAPATTGTSVTDYYVIDKKLLDKFHVDYSRPIGACRAPKGSICKFTADRTVGTTIDTAFTVSKWAVAPSLGISTSTSYKYGMEIDSPILKSYKTVWVCGAMGYYYKYKIEAKTVHPGPGKPYYHYSGWLHAFTPSKNQFGCHWVND